MARAVVEPPNVDAVDTLVEAWLALAEDQRAHGSKLRTDANRTAIREDLSRRVVLGEALVARQRADGEAENGDDRAATTVSLDRPPEDDALVTGERVPGDFLGVVSFGLSADGFERSVQRGEVHNIYVRPGARSRGVGTALLRAAESELADAGADRVALEALAANDRARSFYRRAGYDEHRVELEKSLD